MNGAKILTYDDRKGDSGKHLVPAATDGIRGLLTVGYQGGGEGRGGKNMSGKGRKMCGDGGE